MITGKQRWFIEKLMKKVEELGYDADWGKELLYGCNMFDIYRTSKSDASKDITYLLDLKTKLS